MISITKNADTSERLLKLFQELLNSVPEGTATLGSKRTKNNDGTIVWLTPASKSAAEFGAHSEDGELSPIDVFFGSGTTFELNGDVDKLLELVRSLGLAVISGRCEQRFGFLGVRGKIRLDGGKVYRCTDYFHPRLYPRTVLYQPYDYGSGKS
ncbi:MAG: hypothetical protein LAO23_21775 [Acidobacteriia bacterium]|nr:hypothetical protein [Terriglobia bacterium]